MASSSLMTPAAARAQYSPRLSPAATSGLIPFSSSTRIIAMLAVTMAAWVYSVISSLSFSSKHSSGMEKPINSVALSKILFPVSVCS